MPKYNVWIYPVGKFYVKNVQAESQEEACQNAWKLTQDIRLSGVARLSNRPDAAIDYSDGIDGYLVDEQDNPGHDKSRWYDKDGKERGPEPPIVVVTVSGSIPDISHFGDVELIHINWDNFNSMVTRADLADIEEQMELINAIPDPEVRGAILESYNELKQDFEESEEIVP